MAEYKVKWVIELDAESFEDAAKQALKIQRDKKSTATIFKVSESGNDTEHRVIDLLYKIMTDQDGAIEKL